MDGLTAASSALAVASVAIQVADSCIKLYEFWASVRDAPVEVAFVIEDLKYFTKVVKEIDRDKTYKAPSVGAGLLCCQRKIQDLIVILARLDAGMDSPSRKVRIWTAFKANTRMKQLKKFRESLNEMKSTLMLALMFQRLDAAELPHRLLIPSDSLRRFDATSSWYKDGAYQDKSPRSQESEGSLFLPTSAISDFEGRPTQASPEILVQGGKKSEPWFRPSGITSVLNDEIHKKILKRSIELAIEEMADSRVLQEFLAQSYGDPIQFETICSSEVGLEHYSIKHQATTPVSYCPNMQVKDWAQHAATLWPFRINHKVSSYGCGFGCIWIRSSFIQVKATQSDAAGKFDTITSFIFYPASWLKMVGIQQGVVASVVKSQRGWQFHLESVRARPTNSPIFQLCQAGEARAVELLIADGNGSVFDTSPNGWTPLHFAAAQGHVGLCRSLIRLGANKTALAYEGPATNVLSPIAMFATLARCLSSESKIDMLRLFMDCLDISDPQGDGWIVHYELKTACGKENGPISERSIIWLLRATADERFVAFGPDPIWSALQSAVRFFLVHDWRSGSLQRILSVPQHNTKNIKVSRAMAFGHWLALRGSESRLLPILLEAGRLCQIRGFDWVRDDITPGQFLKSLPVIYATWSIAFPDSINKVEETMHSERELCLTRIGWTLDDFHERLSGVFDSNRGHLTTDSDASRICTGCQDHYGYDGYGLVRPARIKFTECCNRDHRMDCTCTSFLQDLGVAQSFRSENDTEQDDCSVDEEFYDAEADLNTHSVYFSAETRPDPFLDAATMLYRAQGRNWLGDYRANEDLCGTCFLLREDYIDGTGLGTEKAFSPMPDFFRTFRAHVEDCTIDGTFG
ncbi:hypothetical protein K491DRAFT_30399 [Lophiostoma macrostomum CBS 122681]|uniref:Uncharacterized protein n=1 Tax=Lophiostoma macrostomum CBS 122681 TaxID=1314788 RepID=A0A6A6T0Y7_9PLEO|nr:hypothetical protein K491DRAFT_30399 [Lophiostoma macrostomum CBS 122681]